MSILSVSLKLCLKSSCCRIQHVAGWRYLRCAYFPRASFFVLSSRPLFSRIRWAADRPNKYKLKHYSSIYVQPCICIDANFFSNVNCKIFRFLLVMYDRETRLGRYCLCWRLSVWESLPVRLNSIEILLLECGFRVWTQTMKGFRWKRESWARFGAVSTRVLYWFVS